MKLDAQTKEAEKLEVKDTIQVFLMKAKSLMYSEEYTKQKFIFPYLTEKQNRMLKTVAEVNR